MDSETFVKALKDLPLFINTRTDNKNAIKINSILYSYLGLSGEDFLGSDDDLEHGSVSSRCSKRGSDSTIESSPASSQNNSPNGSPIKIDEFEYQPEEQQHGNIRVLDEINIVQAHVPHAVFPPFLTHNEAFTRVGIMGVFPPTAFIRTSFRSFPAPRWTHLCTVTEDAQQTEVVSDDDDDDDKEKDDSKIEEID